MSTLRLRYRCALVLVMFSASRALAADSEFEDWDLEPSLNQAHLVMVARVASVGKVTVVEGAKTDVAVREFRFQPIRRLKGIFQRDQLAMTNVDIGCPAEDAEDGCPLKQGEFRLLILVQQQGLQVMGCVAASPGATTFGQRVPLLSGADDPLVAAVETLIRVADTRSRRERATLLVDRLETTTGLALVPLLNSLHLRADWAGTDARTFPLLAKLTHDQPRAVQSAALELLRDVLASHEAPDGGNNWQGLPEALQISLVPGLGCNINHATKTDDRLAAIEALGYLLGRQVDVPWAKEWLISQLTSATTQAERAAAATALAQLRSPEATAGVSRALAMLPLDEPSAREAIYARALEKLDAREAATVLTDRLNASLIARESAEAEIAPLGRMRVTASLQYLLYAAQLPDLPRSDRYHLAMALGQLHDDTAVPVLIKGLQSTDHRLKEISLAALETIDSPLAAREVRPLLKTEPVLPHKLRIARLVARH
ncbi:MAG: HEAT repeat domain-containing protein, partial [Singulisphaera sp.]